MTVRELKRILNEMPDDADVWVSVESYWEEIATDNADRVELLHVGWGDTVWIRGPVYD